MFNKDIYCWNYLTETYFDKVPFWKSVFAIQRLFYRIVYKNGASWNSGQQLMSKNKMKLQGISCNCKHKDKYISRAIELKSICRPCDSWNSKEVDHLVLALCMLGNFSCFCCGLLTFFKNNFWKNSLRSTIRVSNALVLTFFKINFFKKNSFRNTIRVSSCLDPD